MRAIFDHAVRYIKAVLPYFFPWLELPLELPLAAVWTSLARACAICLPSWGSHGLRPNEYEKLLQPPYDLTTLRSASVSWGSILG